MGDGLVTIVLPIYNVEAYLNRCLKSVVNQTYKKLEIILVDDGSPDRCPELCDKWAEKDNRIKVIHKKNAGLGMARNTGIENATGEYICFFDSDDYIALDTIEKAYGLAKKEKAEIVTFGFCNVKRNRTTGGSTIPKTDKVTYSGKEVQTKFLVDLIAPDVKTGKKTNLWMSAWASIYSMELIHRTDWNFVSEREIISEDIYSLLYLYHNVRRVSVLSETLYYYCENEGSLTRTYRKDRYERIKHFYDKCQNACDELGYGQCVKSRLAYPYLSNTIGGLKMIVTSDSGREERKEALREIVSDEHLQKILSSLDFYGETKARKLLLLAMKRKFHGLVYMLIKVKVR